jgi:hypothetical protein
MRSSLCRLALLMLAVLLIAPAIRAAEPEPLPTQKQLHDMFDAGQYQPLLTKLARVLALKGDPAKGYDMVDLNVLKAEACIQQKQQDMAAVAANEAVKQTTATTDTKLATEARALAALLKHSQNLAYTPKAPPGSKPMPLADRNNRKAAYAALQTDMQSDVDAKLKAAKSSKSLPPIITATQSLGDMSAVETMATGSDTASQKSGDELAAEARTLIDQTLANLDKQVASIEKDADKLIDNPAETNKNGKKGKTTKTEKTAHKAGLSDSMKSQLHTIMDTCTKIISVCDDLAAVSKKEAANYKQASASADKTGKDANRVLTASYDGNVKVK